MAELNQIKPTIEISERLNPKKRKIFKEWIRSRINNFFCSLYFINKIKLNQEFKRQPILIDPASSILPNLIAMDSSNLVILDWWVVIQSNSEKVIIPVKLLFKKRTPIFIDRIKFLNNLTSVCNIS